MYITGWEYKTKLCILQGGKEELADCDGKTNEELYTEARDILDLVAASQSNR